jgi:protease I
MTRAIIITEKGFQDEEYIYPYYRLLEAGFELDVATTGAQTVHGKYGLPAKANVDSTTIRAEDYDLVILPGGHEAPDRVRQIPNVLKFVREMNDAGKVVGAICHGPWVAISAGIVAGRRATSYEGMKDDLVNAGADVVAADVVVDGNLVTAPHYRNNGDFMKAVLEVYAKSTG